MIEVLERFLSDEKESYELNENIFGNLKKEIINSCNLIKKANDLDKKYNNYTINFERLVNLVDNYSSYPVPEKDESKIVVYTGDPYLTLELLLQALKSHTRVLLAFNEYMFGTNELIFSLFYEVLKKYKIKNLVYCVSRISPDFLRRLNSEKKEIIVIGDTLYHQLLDHSTLIPYHNYIIYTETEELKELQETIFQFTTEFEYELEVLYEDNISDVIEQVNNSIADTFILLTTNEDTKERVRREVKDKKLFINENPFKDENVETRLYL